MAESPRQPLRRRPGGCFWCAAVSHSIVVECCQRHRWARHIEYCADPAPLGDIHSVPRRCCCCRLKCISHIRCCECRCKHRAAHCFSGKRAGTVQRSPRCSSSRSFLFFVATATAAISHHRTTAATGCIVPTVARERGRGGCDVSAARSRDGASSRCSVGAPAAAAAAACRRGGRCAAARAGANSGKPPPGRGQAAAARTGEGAAADGQEGTARQDAGCNAAGRPGGGAGVGESTPAGGAGTSEARLFSLIHFARAAQCCDARAPPTAAR